jgi:endonuclease-8
VVRLIVRQSTDVLAGCRVDAVRAHGKHLFIDFDNGMSLRSHLGLYGSWHRYATGERWRRPARQAGIELVADDEVFVCFNPREVVWERSDGLRQRDQAARLGPDLSLPDPDLDEVVARAQRLSPDTLVVDLLLDQTVAAGIGNAYKSELLFLERITPTAQLAGVDDVRLRRLYRRAGELIRANLGGGPRTTRFTGQPGGERMWVYGRYDEPCLVCATPIRTIRHGRGQRSTYWCPTCQGALTSASARGCGRHTVKARCR